MIRTMSTTQVHHRNNTSKTLTEIQNHNQHNTIIRIQTMTTILLYYLYMPSTSWGISYIS